MLKTGSELTLQNNEKYTVIYSTVYNNENYIFLTNNTNINDSCFYKYNNTDNLSLVTDENLIIELLKKYKEEENR